MKLKLYQVDAFTNHVFGGNPAAICPLDEWINDEHMQKIAMENNLAETAFFVQKNNQYEIRWFTPAVEVDLCGHATLAAAHVLFNHLHISETHVNFFSPRSGVLNVTKNNTLLTLDFPTDVYAPITMPASAFSCFQQQPVEAYRGKTDFVFVFKNEQEIIEIQPDFEQIRLLGGRGAIVTAPGNAVDFVSRFFAPQAGINEDPVTGSAHTTLTPYWAKKLGKDHLTALQLSARKGNLTCRYLGERVEISGEAITYLIGEIDI
jgi:PhzF family phenazine biosynthesis protein